MAGQAEPSSELPSEPTAGESSFGGSRILAERRLLSSLLPFTKQVEARTEKWRRLAESGQVSLDTLKYATDELELTARGFEALVDAALAERWSEAELGLLRLVHERIAGPYHLAWKALIETFAKAFTKSSDDPNVVSLSRRGDEAMREVEKAEEVAKTAA